MKLLALSALTTGALFALDHALARFAASYGAAGALLSPLGLSDPIAWLAAGGFFFARLGSAGMLCLTLGLAAVKLTTALFDRWASVGTRA